MDDWRMEREGGHECGERERLGLQRAEEEQEEEGVTRDCSVPAAERKEKAKKVESERKTVRVRTGRREGWKGMDRDAERVKERGGWVGERG